MKSRLLIWLRVITYVGGFLPLVLLGWAYLDNQLIADPIGEITRRLGRTAILFLLLSLVPSLLATLTRRTEFVRVRRAWGLFAFLYVLLHFLSFAGLDYRFDFELLGLALGQDRFILIGLTAFIILIPLALTSTKGAMRSLGRWWKRLHRLVYIAAALAIWHYIWVYKELRTRPLVFGLALGVLLIVRLPAVSRFFRRR